MPTHYSNIPNMFGNLLADLDEPDFLAGYEVDEEELSLIHI